MKRWRGPRLRTKLLLAGSVLLIVPWLGIKIFDQLKAFLATGQVQSLELLANTASLTLSQSEVALFRPAEPEPLPAYPLDNRVEINGWPEEWEPLSGLGVNLEDVNPGDVNLNEHRFSARVLLAARGGRVYGLVEVTDDTPVLKHPGSDTVESFDHLTLHVGNAVHALVFDREGDIASAPVIDGKLVASQRDFRIQAAARMTPSGYNFEFSLPRTMLPSGQLGLQLGDVTDPNFRFVQHRLSTFSQQPNALVIRSDALAGHLSQPAPGVRLWVINARGDVLATAGDLQSQMHYQRGESSRDIATNLLRGITGRIVTASVDLHDPYPPQVTTSRPIMSGLLDQQQRNLHRQTDALLIAASPIIINGQQVGAVIAERSTAQLLENQRDALSNIIALSIGALALLVLVVFGYSARLTYRVRRLGEQTAAAVNPQGQVIHSVGKLAGKRAGDEIGDLTRTLDHTLARLAEQQQFIEQLPRTLRHELNNPLNTITTSLEQIAAHPEQLDHEALSRAERGLKRIREMIETLAYSASLEQTLAATEHEIFDLGAMLSNYIANRNRRLETVRFELASPERELNISGSDIHIEQCLDKLCNNALEFSPPDQPIVISIGAVQRKIVITITNQGPPLPDTHAVFQLMYSHRDASLKSPENLGIGLYVARTIALQHGGNLRGENLPNGSGVRFTLTLPRANK